MGKISILFLSQEDVEIILSHDTDKILGLVTNSLLKYTNGSVLLPDKISQVFDQHTQNRINCMPATILDENVCGVKWVSVFPTNNLMGKQNVTGVILLSEIESGFPIAIIDGTLCTKFRTAAVGGVAAKLLAPSTVQTIGIIGTGEEARMHYAILKHIFPSIKTCRISSRREHSEDMFIECFKDLSPDVEFIPCRNNIEKCACSADIIVTAISSQEPVLKAQYLKKGCLYIHVGGWEDEYGVALISNKIICDDWESTKHRTQTISRMYKEGILTDANIYANLSDILFNGKPGRESDDEIIYFNSVGLSFIDVNFASHIYNEAKAKGLGKEIELSNGSQVNYTTII